MFAKPSRFPVGLNRGGRRCSARPNAVFEDHKASAYPAPAEVTGGHRSGDPGCNPPCPRTSTWWWQGLGRQRIASNQPPLPEQSAKASCNTTHPRFTPSFGQPLATVRCAVWEPVWHKPASGTAVETFDMYPPSKDLKRCLSTTHPIETGRMVTSGGGVISHRTSSLCDRF